MGERVVTDTAVAAGGAPGLGAEVTLLGSEEGKDSEWEGGANAVHKIDSSVPKSLIFCSCSQCSAANPAH